MAFLCFLQFLLVKNYKTKYKSMAILYVRDYYISTYFEKFHNKYRCFNKPHFPVFL